MSVNEEDEYERSIRETMARSRFTDENISIGAPHEWQWIVDAIKKYAEEHDQTHVIIHTGLIEHNINVPMVDMYYKYDYHEEGDDFPVTLGKISVIAAEVDKVEDAILDFQKLKMVSGLPDHRSYMGPNQSKDITSYFRYGYRADEAREMQVTLSWDS